MFATPLRASLQRNDATYISSCSELLGEGINIDFSAFFEKINKINDRFADFDLLKAKMEPFNNTIKVDIELQPLYLQQELHKLQSDSFLLSRKNERYETFWKLVSKEQFPYLRNFAQKMCSKFGSTYVCESAFSIMQRIKSNTRTK